MAADNHLMQLAELGLKGPDRSHWPTYDKSISTVHHVGLNGLHIVADLRVYRSSYSSSEVAMILAAGTTTLRRGWLKRIQSILLLPQQAAINLDMALSSLHCQTERFTTTSMLPPPSFLSYLLFLYFHTFVSSFLLLPFLPPFSILHFLIFSLYIPVSPRVKHPPLPHCNWGTHTDTAVNAF